MMESMIQDIPENDRYVFMTLLLGVPLISICLMHPNFIVHLVTWLFISLLIYVIAGMTIIPLFLSTGTKRSIVRQARLWLTAIMPDLGEPTNPRTEEHSSVDDNIDGGKTEACDINSDDGKCEEKEKYIRHETCDVGTDSSDASAECTSCNTKTRPGERLCRTCKKTADILAS